MVGDAIKSEYEIEIVFIEQDNEFELVVCGCLPEDAKPALLINCWMKFN